MPGHEGLVEPAAGQVDAVGDQVLPAEGRRRTGREVGMGFSLEYDIFDV